MKIMLFLICAGSILISLISCANIYKMNKAELSVVPSDDIKTNPAKWENLGKDIMAGKEYVFLVKKGQTVPVKLSASAPFGRLVAGKNSIAFDRDVYLLISKSKMRISPDAESWADIYDMNALKNLFGWGKGSLSLGFSATKDDGPQITLDLSAR